MLVNNSHHSDFFYFSSDLPAAFGGVASECIDNTFQDKCTRIVKMIL